MIGKVERGTATPNKLPTPPPEPHHWGLFATLLSSVLFMFGTFASAFAYGGGTEQTQESRSVIATPVHNEKVKSLADLSKQVLWSTNSFDVPIEMRSVVSSEKLEKPVDVDRFYGVQLGSVVENGGGDLRIRESGVKYCYLFTPRCWTGDMETFHFDVTPKTHRVWRVRCVSAASPSLSDAVGEIERLHQRFGMYKGGSERRSEYDGSWKIYSSDKKRRISIYALKCDDGYQIMAEARDLDLAKVCKSESVVGGDSLKDLFGIKFGDKVENYKYSVQPEDYVVFQNGPEGISEFHLRVTPQSLRIFEVGGFRRCETEAEASQLVDNLVDMVKKKYPNIVGDESVDVLKRYRSKRAVEFIFGSVPCMMKVLAICSYEPEGSHETIVMIVAASGEVIEMSDREKFYKEVLESERRQGRESRRKAKEEMQRSEEELRRKEQRQRQMEERKRQEQLQSQRQMGSQQGQEWFHSQRQMEALRERQRQIEEIQQRQQQQELWMEMSQRQMEESRRRMEEFEWEQERRRRDEEHDRFVEEYRRKQQERDIQRRRAEAYRQQQAQERWMEEQRYQEEQRQRQIEQQMREQEERQRWMEEQQRIQEAQREQERQQRWMEEQQRQYELQQQEYRLRELQRQQYQLQNELMNSSPGAIGW